MKYLIMEDFSGQAAPFIFPRRVDHEDMRDQLPYGKVLSAGLIELKDNELFCHGGHAGLGIESGPNDAEIIIQYLKLA